MTETITMEALARRIVDRAASGRIAVAIAGAPGSGKSTVSEHLRDEINAAAPGLAEILPMDGFHYDDMVLEARGHRPRKGAPHTFDVDGLAATLGRLLADNGREVAVPVFDRSIEIARAGARIIGPQARVILVEGNYLLLDDPAWAELRDHFALTVMLDVPEEVLTRRLTERWTGYGLSGEALRTKMEGNDLPNVRLVLEKSVPADVRLANAG
ncbi:nucleoside triphosphate hydrolase [Aurantimonas sp. VKM B-3413]|uniref:nucleoside triphosphate hydrolase n=1 Tax=Aurantimonas sp. VKM B-3413 TaxID=2779401 RepID=UPI0021045181|nr:nucleoside triphosphate hydrolase [Aurantimonas sp. VKM B-3413]